jgi:hypothetical protein
MRHSVEYDEYDTNTMMFDDALGNINTYNIKIRSDPKLISSFLGVNSLSFSFDGQ